jgi:hypothetical protein
MQAKHVRQTDPKERFEAVYLSEVLLLNNRAIIEQKVLDNIIGVSFGLFIIFLMFYLFIHLFLNASRVHINLLSKSTTVYDSSQITSLIYAGHQSATAREHEKRYTASGLESHATLQNLHSQNMDQILE